MEIVAVVVLVLAAISLAVANIVIGRRVRPQMDRVIRVGGLTVEQVKTMRRALFAGRLPDDPALHPVALKHAAQVAQNAPLEARFVPLTFFASALLVLVIAIIGGDTLPVAVPLMAAVVLASLGAYLILANMRAARNCRALLVAAPPADPEQT